MAKQLIETYSDLNTGLQQWVLDALAKCINDDQGNFVTY